MNWYLIIYLAIAMIVSDLIYRFMNNSGLTGDNIIAMLEDEEDRLFLYDHPNFYRWALVIAIVMAGLFWPVSLIYIINNKDNFNNFN